MHYLTVPVLYLHARTYCEPIWLISRWVTLLTFFLMLTTYEAIVVLFSSMSPRRALQNQHTVDATAKVGPGRVHELTTIPWHPGVTRMVLHGSPCRCYPSSTPQRWVMSRSCMGLCGPTWPAPGSGRLWHVPSSPSSGLALPRCGVVGHQGVGTKACDSSAAPCSSVSHRVWGATLACRGHFQVLGCSLQVLMMMHLLEHILLMCMYGVLLLYLHK